MFTFSEMLALVESESSFGVYVCHRRPGGSLPTSDLVTNRTFRPHGLPQQNREQSGEGRSYIPVPRQREIGAPVPGTVSNMGGGGGGRRNGEE